MPFQPFSSSLFTSPITHQVKYLGQGYADIDLDRVRSVVDRARVFVVTLKKFLEQTLLVRHTFYTLVTAVGARDGFDGGGVCE